MSPSARRSSLKALGPLSLPAWFPRLAFSTAPDGPGPGQRDLLVCVFQRGAADGLNTVVPVGDSAYYANRPTIGIAEPAGGGAARGTNPALRLGGFLAPHPAPA